MQNPVCSPKKQTGGYIIPNYTLQPQLLKI